MCVVLTIKKDKNLLPLQAKLHILVLGNHKDRVWSKSYLPQLQRAPIVKVLYKQANIGFAAEAVFFWGGKGAFHPKKGCNAPFAGYYGFLRKKNLRKLHMYCKLL